MQITRDIYLVAGSVYGTGSNIYAIRHKAGVALVDPGMNEGEISRTSAVLAQWELASLPITDVLLTHEHFEHSGNALYYQKMGACIHAGAAAADALSAGDWRVAHYAHALEKPYISFHADHAMQNGEKMLLGETEIQCIFCPGHSAGSVAYLMNDGEKKILFVGDTIIPQILCMHAKTGWTGSPDFDCEQLLGSLEHLTEIEPDVLLSAHGEICVYEGRQLIWDALVQTRMALRHAAKYPLHF